MPSSKSLLLDAHLGGEHVLLIVLHLEHTLPTEVHATDCVLRPCFYMPSFRASLIAPGTSTEREREVFRSALRRKKKNCKCAFRGIPD